MRIPQIWLGSDESYTQHLVNRLNYLADPASYATHPEFTARSAQTAQLSADDDDESSPLAEYLADRLIEKAGNVGIVKISGSLVSDEGFQNLWFDEVAYSSISRALKVLAEDSAVQSILTVWDTPGGDASGINDLGMFIKDVNKVKPVHAWTGTMALSAGYWGAACCKSVRSSDMGETGSIGAVAKFRSYARLLQEEGIDTVVARSAPMKAILQSEEPIDDKKRAYLQSKVDQLHTFFVDHIKQARPKLKELSESKWATGETFYGNKAIELGLVDGPVISLNQLVSQLQAKIDKNKPTLGRPMTTVLSEQMIAQLMSGVSLDGGTPSATALATTPESPALSDGKAGTAANTAVGTAVGADEEESEALAVGTLQAAPDFLTEYLEKKVAALEEKILEVTLRAEKAETKLSEAAGLDDLLRPIVIEATQRLQVALGQTPSNYAEVPSRALAGSYRATLEEFEKRFKSGRVSAQAQDASRQATSLAELRLISSAH